MTDTQISTLPNGVVVATEKVPGVRSVSMGIYLDIGSRDETLLNNGIAHFFEHMVFKGTENHTGLEIAQSFEATGGQVNAFTSKEQTCFFAKVVDKQMSQSLDLLLEMTLKPEFDLDEIKKEKEVVIEEIRGGEDNPEEHIYDLFSEAYYGKHSLGFPIAGTYKSVKHLDETILNKHLHTITKKAPYYVIAVGNVKHQEVLQKVCQHFDYPIHKASKGLIGRKMRKALFRPSPRNSATHVKHIKPVQQANVILGGPGFSMDDNKRYPLMLMNCILGEGMSSRLFQHLREDFGLVYNVYSNPEFMSGTGVFYIGFATEVPHLKKSIQLINQEFERLKLEGLSAAEIDFAAHSIEGNILLGLESTHTRMGHLVRKCMHQTQEPIDEFLKKLKRVTPKEIKETARYIFKQNKWASAAILPKGCRLNIGKMLKF